MQGKKLLRTKGRRYAGKVTLFPYAVEISENWQKCGGTAIKLLHFLAAQYNTTNNGDLSAPLSAKPGGITSGETLSRALRELEHYGFIVKARQGGLGFPSLYAITWHAIDRCSGKLEIPATTTAPGTWKEARPKFNWSRLKKQNASTESVSGQYGIRTGGLKKAA